MQKYAYKYGTIYHADVLAAARQIDSESVDCVITSPPYWQLRDYGYPEQWGLEPTYQEYLAHLQELMKELWRIVKPTGTVWVNLGDSYNGSGVNDGSVNQGISKAYKREKIEKRAKADLPSKCLLLIPHRFAIDCIENGWILRNDIAWAKPNAMPESVLDRFAKKHEFMFVFSKQPKYYFDLNSVREPHKETSKKRACRGRSSQNKYAQDISYLPQGVHKNTISQERAYIGYANMEQEIANGNTALHPLGKNCGDVSKFWEGQNISLEDFLELATEYYHNQITDLWEINTKPNPSEHYASYNLDLIKKPILAGCPVGGLIYDPFMGSGMSAIAAMEYGRLFIGSEASGKYIKISHDNILEREKEIEYKKAQVSIFGNQ